MDKYQIFVLKNTEYSAWNGVPFDSQNTNKPQNAESQFSCIADDDYKILIYQDENYNIVKYNLVFWKSVDKVIANGVEYIPQNVKYHDDLVVVPIDFNNQVKELKLHFHEVIDPITIPVEFIAADRTVYDEKVELERQKGLEEKANISISTGTDLVNVYFQSCDDNYGKSVIELWLAEGKYTEGPLVMGKHDTFTPHLIVSTCKATRMIGKYNVDEGMMFKSITALAKGAYGVVVSQFDNKGNLLFKSDFRFFKI